MNKQIRKLYLEASKEYDGANGICIPDDFVEKFAELIVQECADYVNWRQENYNDADISKVIKQHFGVE